jgi:proline racemase
MRPVGFNSFECSPRLPNGWDHMALKNIHSFGHVFDVMVNRAGVGRLAITIHNGEKQKKYVIKDGATQLVQL